MAIEVEKSIVINRPLDDVFAFISNLQNEHLWSSAVSSGEYLQGGPGEVGSIARLVATFLGREIETLSKTTAHEHNHKMGFELVEGMVTGKGSREVEAIGNTTRVTQKFDFEFGSVFRAMKFVLKPALQKQLDGDFKKLKAILEAEKG